VATIGRRQQVVDRANEIRANVFIPRRRQPLLQRFEEVWRGGGGVESAVGDFVCFNCIGI